MKNKSISDDAWDKMLELIDRGTKNVTARQPLPTTDRAMEDKSDSPVSKSQAEGSTRLAPRSGPPPSEEQLNCNPGNKGPTKKQYFYSASDLRAMPTKPWIIEGLCVRGDVGIIYGASGAGKTFVILGMIAALARGADPFGREMEPQQPLRTVCIMAEGSNGIVDRLDALREKGWLKDDQEEHLRFVPFSIPLHGSDEEWDKFITAVEELPHMPDVFVFDTLSQCTLGADENSTGDMALVIDRLRRLANKFDAVVMVVHHTGWKDLDKIRGSSVLQANVDFALAVVKGGKNALSTLEFVKVRNARSGYSIGFTLEECGQSLVATWQGEVSASLTRTDKVIAWLRDNNIVSEEVAVTSKKIALALDLDFRVVDKSLAAGVKAKEITRVLSIPGQSRSKSNPYQYYLNS